VSERIVHLLRHGPPLRSGLLLGHTDEPALDPDCPRMRAAVERLPIAQVVASDLTRASGQAANLARRLAVPLSLDSGWRELAFGAWDGLAPEVLDKDALARFWNDPEGYPPPDGERWSSLCVRVGRSLAALKTGTLVVTHGGAMRAALAALTGLDHRGVWALDLPYRALLSLRIWPGEPVSGHVIGLATGVQG
jgi:alpha-ribazole phosphatase